ncbi:Hydroxyethylthiazole kinase [Acidipropionibacterium jensenii]|uniref:Hydroxyethylthiazole kinase n=1 Tax=Acidipropionibacterium jensenii TaxID=1749 RepID=A0A448NZ55_9ACTN|nr:hydroxyethylthiazole kinase [Acidipropionibacterium jensenii]VEI03216.1 Hydroxyethylthiazole kinase [Acidipropionibacterium jensenii]
MSWGLHPDLAEDRDLAEVADVIARTRRRPPLVHCISAAVSMDLVANGLLAAGARPVMTETLQEAPAVTGIADILLVNFGTLSTDAMDGIPATVEAARRAGHLWVLDPTAIGAAPIRTRMARDLLAGRPAVVRGNASEILALTGGGGGRGADSEDPVEDARGAAETVAGQTGGAVAVSGRVDLVVGAGEPRRVARGDPMMARVTGTGCLLGGLVAACLVASTPASTSDSTPGSPAIAASSGPGTDLAAESAPTTVPSASVPDPTRAATAALAATVWMNLAGELAGWRAARPGSFRMALLDALDEVGEAAERLDADRGLEI